MQYRKADTWADILTSCVLKDAVMREHHLIVSLQYDRVIVIVNEYQLDWDVKWSTGDSSDIYFSKKISA